MRNLNEQKALELVSKQVGYLRDTMLPADIVHDLSAAGLIVTPLHERALAACEEYARACVGETGNARAPWQAVYNIGRESIALKPPAGWYADGKCVRYRPSRPEADAIVCPNSLTAERVAKALNAQEGK